MDYCSLLSRCTKLGDWRSLAFEGVSSFSTFSCRTNVALPLTGDWKEAGGLDRNSAFMVR
jgi:hypothetical protein